MGTALTHLPAHPGTVITLSGQARHMSLLKQAPQNTTNDASKKNRTLCSIGKRGESLVTPPEIPMIIKTI